MENEILLSAKGVSKRFGGVQALDQVDLTIRKGEIHCLAGENGCGKSTLIKIISGFYKPDAGVIEFEGKSYHSLAIQQSIQMGIQVIYQDMSIFPNLSVAENIAMNHELYNRKKLVNWKNVRQVASEALQHIGVEIALDERVGDLSVADKQLVAIARSMLYNSRLIIMDEPTSALTRREVDKLFDVIKQLQKEGVSILFVSHKLDEVFEIADRFTVFRNGKLIVTDSAKNVDNDLFIYYMTGRRLEENYYVPAKVDTGRCLLRVENLCLHNGFENISFAIHPGELLGITGLLGSGRTELAKTLFGLYQADSGSIYIDGEKVSIRSPMDALRQGVAYLPEDRLTEGLFLSQPIDSNIVISSIQNLVRKNGEIDRARISETAAHWVDNLSVKIGQYSDPVNTLSGGNQQKIVLSKWLETKPRILILNGPTVGVDIGSKYALHTYLRELAAKMDIAIMLISDDIPEVLMNCNRILIVRNGRIVSEHKNTELDQHTLFTLITDTKGVVQA